MRLYQHYYDDKKDEDWFKCMTLRGFNSWCRDGGWDGGCAFAVSTGVSFPELKGRWFTVAHNRVYLKEWE